MPFYTLVSRGAGLGNIGGRGSATKAFKLRQIITTGYVMGGYANSSPWTNVGSINHSNDVATNHGNLLGGAGGYIGGGCSLTVGYAFGTGGMSSYSTASRFSMATKTGLSDQGMPQSVGDCESIQNSSPTNGGATAIYITGNSSGMTKLVPATDTYTNFGTSVNQGGTGVSSHMTENWGTFWADDQSGRKFVFSTEAESTSPGSGSSGNAGWHGQQKGISSKNGFGWAGNEGGYNSGYNLRRWNYTTESMTGTVSKPIGNSGEENFDMGQDRQYMLGMYDGAQNNRAWRFTYATESGSELGSGSQPSWAGSGRSSGACSWGTV